MYKIQTLNKISTLGLELFPRDEYEIASEIMYPDAAVLRSFDMHDMVLPDSLKVIARAGAGVNNIPIDKCSQKGVVVLNTPGANADIVKELTLASSRASPGRKRSSARAMRSPSSSKRENRILKAPK
jgi:D-3-phosphoglycerate dehydrogenase